MLARPDEWMHIYVSVGMGGGGRGYSLPLVGTMGWGELKAQSVPSMCCYGRCSADKCWAGMMYESTDLFLNIPNLWISEPGQYIHIRDTMNHPYLYYSFSQSSVVWSLLKLCLRLHHKERALYSNITTEGLCTFECFSEFQKNEYESANLTNTMRVSFI